MKEAAVKDYLLYEQYNYITVVNYYTVLSLIQNLPSYFLLLSQNIK